MLGQDGPRRWWIWRWRGEATGCHHSGTCQAAQPVEQPSKSAEYSIIFVLPNRHIATATAPSHWFLIFLKLARSRLLFIKKQSFLVKKADMGALRSFPLYALRSKIWSRSTKLYGKDRSEAEVFPGLSRARFKFRVLIFFLPEHT